MKDKTDKEEILLLILDMDEDQAHELFQIMKAMRGDVMSEKIEHYLDVCENPKFDALLREYQKGG